MSFFRSFLPGQDLDAATLLSWESSSRSRVGQHEPDFGDVLPAWPQYDAKNQLYLFIGPSSLSVRPRFRHYKMTFWSLLADKMAKEETEKAVPRPENGLFPGDATGESR